MYNIHAGYVSAVAKPFVASIKEKEIQDKVTALINDIRLKQNVETIETRAQSILANLPNSNATDSKRYKFKLETSRDTLLKTIFDRSFNIEPNPIINAAAKVEAKNGPFYPKWKIVCHIKCPYQAARLFNNQLFKVAVSITVIASTLIFIGVTYAATVEFTASKIPFIINHTPLAVIRAGNAIYDLKNYIFDNPFTVLIYCFVAREVVKHLRLPYLTPLAKKVNLVSLFLILAHSPQTIAEFAISCSINIAVSGWVACTEISSFFVNHAKQANNEALGTCRPKCYKIWQSAMAA